MDKWITTTFVEGTPFPHQGAVVPESAHDVVGTSFMESGILSSRWLRRGGKAHAAWCRKAS